MSQTSGAPSLRGNDDCTRCASCDKGTCGTFQDVAARKGRDFADNWWKKKEAIQKDKQDKANDNGADAGEKGEAKTQFNSAATQLTHLALHVTDIEASVEFYKKWAGMKEIERRVSDRSGGTVVWVACEGQEDDFIIVLLDGAKQKLDPEKEGMRHIGLSVPAKSDVKAIAEAAKREGVLHWDCMELPFPVGTLCAVKDPDGNIVEFSYGQPLGPDFKAQEPNP